MLTRDLFAVANLMVKISNASLALYLTDRFTCSQRSEVESRVEFESLKTWVGLAKMTDVQLWSAVKNTGHTSPYET